MGHSCHIAPFELPLTVTFGVLFYGPFFFQSHILVCMYVLFEYSKT